MNEKREQKRDIFATVVCLTKSSVSAHASPSVEKSSRWLTIFHVRKIGNGPINLRLFARKDGIPERVAFYLSQHNFVTFVLSSFCVNLVSIVDDSNASKQFGDEFVEYIRH